jgi:hypothetical protein
LQPLLALWIDQKGIELAYNNNRQKNEATKTGSGIEQGRKDGCEIEEQGR